MNFKTNFSLKFAACILSILFILPGCSLKPKRASKLYQGTIVIGYQNWPGYLALLVAYENSYFKEAGLDVQVKGYPGLAELSRDYVQGKIQGRANLTLDALNEHIQGLDHKIILAIDYSSGSDAIATKKSILAVQDFHGLRVAYEPNTLEEFFLTWALQEYELDLTDIISVSATPEEAVQLLKTDKADVAVSYEPYLSELSGDEFHRVYSSADAPGLITDVLTFRTDFIRDNPDTIDAIVSAYFRAIAFWKENPDEAHAIVAKYYKETPDAVARQLLGITVLDRRENEEAFTFSSGFRSLYGNLRQIGFFLRSHDKSLKYFNTDELIEPRFIRKLANE